MQEWEKLSEKNPSRSQWGWKTRYVNYIYPNRHDVDEEYSSTSSSSTSSHDRRKSSSSSSDANNNVTAAERALKRLRSNEKLDLPKKKHSRLDAPTSISVARRGTHTKKLTVVAPTMEMSSSSFTRADFVAAMNWVASRSRPNGIYQNLASWEQFAEQHPSHDAEEWVQFYYSERRLFKAIEERLGDISH
ncbi:uncharacterized protein EI90DRAFT_3044896 [Cantharellus anzutake]|uniref:uncharacterized protein n=1 Tax=Cantharellus anzutake TaxID=1750568 RepID=UPI0019047272|nr:uncharacterized protein EI90DRAFT_3044896 [Cantharellus anzutake]KAF8337100.1 hypothetical protein EI90DRAFT_3044896 [Cantharellus anzutake]